MNGVVLDTHALIWFYHDLVQLSSTAKETIQRYCVEEPGSLIISVISLIEIRYLVERYRLPEQLERDVWIALRDLTSLLEVHPVDEAIAQRLQEIPRAIVHDMPDRLIAATAPVHGLPLISKDEKIRELKSIQVIW